MLGGGRRSLYIRWENGFEISTTVREGEIAISANKEGMLSLANILADLEHTRLSLSEFINTFGICE